LSKLHTSQNLDVQSLFTRGIETHHAYRNRPGT